MTHMVTYFEDGICIIASSSLCFEFPYSRSERNIDPETSYCVNTYRSLTHHFSSTISHHHPSSSIIIHLRPSIHRQASSSIITHHRPSSCILPCHHLSYSIHRPSHTTHHHPSSIIQHHPSSIIQHPPSPSIIIRHPSASLITIDHHES